jgi:hypothetical protein
MMVDDGWLISFLGGYATWFIEYYELALYGRILKQTLVIAGECVAFFSGEILGTIKNTDLTQVRNYCKTWC